MKSTKTIISAAVLGLLTAFVISPWAVLYSAKTSLDAGEPVPVIAILDLPSVKEGMKQDLRAVMNDNFKPGNTQEAVGAAFASGLADQFVEAQITPENISRFVRGFKKDDEDRKKSEEKGDKKPSRDKEDKTGYSTAYTGLNSFEVKVFQKDDRTKNLYVVKMERDGFISWKVKRVDFSGIFDIIKSLKK